jgi:hypothetical protein
METDHTAWTSIVQTHSLILGGLAGSRAAVHFAVSLLGDHGRIVSGFRTNSVTYIFFNLKQWLRDGRDAYRSANNVSCVYETIPLYYVLNVIDRHADKELFADDDWHWLKSAVQANKLDVTSAGLWHDPKEPSVQLALAPQGNVRLLSRERGTPAERGIVPLDIFQGTPQRRLSLPPPHSVDEEEKACLKEVEVSARLEFLDEQQEATTY